MTRSFRRLLAWVRRRPAASLAIYWVFAVIITHVPPLREPDPNRRPRLPLDKVVHFSSYAVLAWLMMNVLARRLSPAPAALVTAAILMVYGVFDELTQPPFRRTADPWDWAADVVGVAAGLIWFAWTARRSSRRHRSTSNQ